MSGRAKLLWVLQVVFGLFFVAIGALHFVVPEGLPSPMAWMYDLSDPAHMTAGIAEILGGLGLILPGLTKIAPQLTVLAAAGLGLVMIGAAIWHISRGEIQNVLQNVVLGAIMAFIAYGRWKLEPLPGRDAPTSGSATPSN